MLCAQLLALRPVSDERLSPRYVGVGHQDVDRVVDDDGHVDGVDRLELAGALAHAAHAVLTLPFAWRSIHARGRGWSICRATTIDRAALPFLPFRTWSF